MGVMKKHPDSHRFSAFLDGDLPSAELRELEEHLSSCEGCASLVEDLERIREEARALPDSYPVRDLWPGIAEAIAGEAGRVPALTGRDPDVIRLHPEASRVESRLRRRIQFTLPQAAAAGLVLALASGAAGARLGAGGDVPAPGEVAESTQSFEASWVRLVGEARPDLAATAGEVARLEEVLAEHRGELDPLTAQVLERSLRAIDRAIEESVLALRADPKNRFLESNLERAVQAKSEYLQDASRFIVPIT
jgi:anti-sigma factor RsiW